MTVAGPACIAPSSDPLFQRSWALSSRLEGGWVNDRRDRGGETYRGVARRFHPGWPGWEIIDRGKHAHGGETADFLAWVHSAETRALLEPHVQDFYFDGFWRGMIGGKPRLQCDAMPWPLCFVCFDAAIHHGPDAEGDGWDSGRFLQRALRLQPADGWVGPGTLRALDRALAHQTPERIAWRCVDDRRDYMADLFAGGHAHVAYVKGWWRRLDEVRAVIAGYREIP